MIENTSYEFNLDCGFNHMSHIFVTKRFQVDMSNHYQVMDHFRKVCKGFACFLTERLLTVLAIQFCTRVKP